MTGDSEQGAAAEALMQFGFALVGAFLYKALARIVISNGAARDTTMATR